MLASSLAYLARSRPVKELVYSKNGGTYQRMTAEFVLWPATTGECTCMSFLRLTHGPLHVNTGTYTPTGLKT